MSRLFDELSHFNFAKALCKKTSSTASSHPTSTNQPPVPAPPSNPTPIPTTSAVGTPPSSATPTEGPVTNSPPPINTVASTQVDPAAISDTTSSTVDNPDPGNGNGPTNSGPGSSGLPSPTNQFGVPFGSDPTHGMATSSGAYNADSSVPALSSNVTKGPNVGAIVGGILGAITFLLLLLLLVLWLMRRRKKGRTAPSAEFLVSPRPFTGTPQFQRIGSTYETQSVNSLRGPLTKVDIQRS